MTIEAIKIPKYVKWSESLIDFIYWLDSRYEIKEYVTVRMRKYNDTSHWGWCEPNESTGDIDVVINTKNCKTKKTLLETLAHEFVHVDQWDKERYVMGEFEYKDDPNEKEAWDTQSVLVKEYNEYIRNR